MKKRQILSTAEIVQFITRRLSIPWFLPNLGAWPWCAAEAKSSNFSSGGPVDLINVTAWFMKVVSCHQILRQASPALVILLIRQTEAACTSSTHHVNRDTCSSCRSAVLYWWSLTESHSQLRPWNKTRVTSTHTSPKAGLHAVHVRFFYEWPAKDSSDRKVVSEFSNLLTHFSVSKLCSGLWKRGVVQQPFPAEEDTRKKPSRWNLSMCRWQRRRSLWCESLCFPGKRHTNQ